MTTPTIARIKKMGKDFEILVDMEKALAFRKKSVDNGFLEVDKIFADSKKGLSAPTADLQKAFGTDDVSEIAKRIVKEGEVQTTQEYRSEEHEKKFKQVIDFLSKNALNPQTGNPHTPDRIKRALEEAHINIKNAPIENQIPEILEQLSKVIPIKIEMKRVRIIIPAMHTGKAYGVISQYKESENWLNDGSLEVVVKVPAGMIMDFYDKLNGVTHGSATTEEMK
jgi:ribosome maturation protein SDO1